MAFYEPVNVLQHYLSGAYSVIPFSSMVWKYEDARKLLGALENIDHIDGAKHCSESRMYLRQWLIAMNMCIACLTTGLAHGHGAILLQQLKPTAANDTTSLLLERGEMFGKPEIVVDSVDFQSWIVSLMLLFGCPGCWALTAFSKFVGRRKIALFSLALYTISWIMIAFADGPYQVMIGRSLSGFCISLLSGLISAYQGELALPRLRSTLNTFQTTSLYLGIGLTHAVGIWFHWRTTALFCGVVTFIALLMNFLTPESPIWLLNKNRFPEAIRSWTYLRGIRDLDELKSLHVKLARQSSITGTKSNRRNHKGLLSATFLKPLGILLALFAVGQMSGMGAVMYYCIQMMTDIAGPERAYIPTLILDTFRIAASICVPILTRRYCTRHIMLASVFNTSIFLVLLSGCIYFKIWAPWIALIVFFAYEAAVSMGLGGLPWTFCSELFPGSHKEIGISIVINFYYAMFFLFVKTSPYILALLQPWGSFLFFGLMTFASWIVLYLILPNTKNKSLKEIELMFSNGGTVDKQSRNILQR
ncbi:hypothetical protein QAD02_010469 [Eretmocerus hayati]|uniref:Uncharacterized protein n=1 Tax=Eretmocerus hayati TaxID=131215 RepID=A0ACC2NUY8_9HYME|nr:hypothetical protein QAD02_010469 [Eretmocerus hayati]